ncbi:hypothetical protein HYU11_06495 [Candidatus Woesearchaeota archaeon]|nr:hypothetical protein [Candidatus Woesearchaeota archaeon]
MFRRLFYLSLPFASIVFAFIIFGSVGFFTLVTFWALFLLPALSLLSRLELDDEERFFFSVFISLGVFPVLVYYLDKFVPSFRMSAVLVFALVVSSGLLWLYLRRK